MTILISILYQ